MSVGDGGPTEDVHVLIVDDEAPVRRVCARILGQVGYRTSLAGTATEAEEMLGRQDIDLILSDIGLPDDRELRLLDRLPADRPVGVVLMTGNPTYQTAVRALRAGVYDYLVKPFEVEELSESVGRAAAKVRSERLLKQVAHNAEVLAKQLEVQATLARGAKASFADPLARLEKMLADLTAREREICELLGRGHSTDEVGERLHISRNTVRNHAKAIYRKLGVRSQLQLVRLLEPGKVA